MHPTSTSPTVLVTGATGFTGSALVRKLHAAGHRVRAIRRPSSNPQSLSDIPVDWVVGEVFDPDTVSRAVRDVSVIYHVAACFREAKYQDDQYRKVHVVSTRLLAEAACGLPDFQRFVHVSTMGVHGHIEHPPGHEDSPFAPGDIYQITKLEAEQWIRAFAASRGLPLTVIRPTAIYGPGDRRLLKLFRMARRPFFPLLGRGQCLYHLVHVDDLADAMIRAAESEAALGGVFLIGHDHAIPVADMARIIADTLGTRTRILRLPATPFFLAAAVCEAVCVPLGIEPPLHRRRVAFYTKDRSFDTSRMREVLGVHCHCGVEEGIRDTARWYREQGWL